MTSAMPVFDRAEVRTKIEMALAEVGYPDAHMEGGTWVNCPRPNSEHARSAMWMAGYLASRTSGFEVPCWACWEASGFRSQVGNDAYRCFGGDCAHPEGPKTPPVDDPPRRAAGATNHDERKP